MTARHLQLSAHPLGADLLSWPIPTAAATGIIRRAAGQYLRAGWDMSLSCDNQNLNDDSNESVKGVPVWEALGASSHGWCRQDNTKVCLPVLNSHTIQSRIDSVDRSFALMPYEWHACVWR